MKYFNNWEKVDDIHKDFLNYGEWESGKRFEDFPTDEEILFASYEQGGYEGDSIVLFKRNGKFYYNSAGHCSCYGLEGLWEPDEVIPEQLLKMSAPYDDHGSEAIEAWKKIIAAIHAVKVDEHE
jgi:hypothetical protein